jgi:hypothetical protein
MKILSILSLLFLLSCQQDKNNQAGNGNKPNIIVILADDMGYSNIN